MNQSAEQQATWTVIQSCEIQLGLKVFGMWHNFCSFASVQYITPMECKSNSQDVTEVQPYTFNSRGLIPSIEFTF